MSLGKVKFTGKMEYGVVHKDEVVHALKHLKEGCVYDVLECDMHHWNSYYILDGYEGLRFNTSLFEHCYLFEKTRFEYFKNYFGYDEDKINED